NNSKDQKAEKILKKQQRIDAFLNGTATFLAIDLNPEEWAYLNNDPRRYAECKVIETTSDGRQTVYKNVAVKVKGGVGSFQGLHKKLGLTLNCDKYKCFKRCYGMEKFHLNNGAQDPGMLNEYIGGEIARAAEVPASRCQRVMVTLNGGPASLYVFKEGFTND